MASGPSQRNGYPLPSALYPGPYAMCPFGCYFRTGSESIRSDWPPSSTPRWRPPSQFRIFGTVRDEYQSLPGEPESHEQTARSKGRGVGLSASLAAESAVTVAGVKEVVMRRGPGVVLALAAVMLAAACGSGRGGSAAGSGRPSAVAQVAQTHSASASPSSSPSQPAQPKAAP